MQIEVLQEELLKGMNIVLRAVSSRTQLPILSSIKIEAQAAGLILSATDLEIGIKTSVAAKVEKQGVIAVPAKTFNELLTTLKPGKLSLNLVEQNLLVKAGSFVGKIMTVDASEFPKMPSSTTALIEIAGNEFARGVAQVNFASAKDSLRPVLTGVLLEVSERLRMVATDGFRLAVASLGIKGSSATGVTTLLLPARAILEVGKVMKDGMVKIGYLPENKQVLFETESLLFVSQIIEGNFPDYNKILPKEFVVELVASKEELLSAVKTAMVFARDNSNMMRWKLSEGKLIITSSSGSSGEGLVEVPVKIEGEEVEVVFNAKYVMDHLLLSEGSSVWIGLGGKLLPGMMAESQEKRDQAFYVVMPINA